MVGPSVSINKLKPSTRNKRASISQLKRKQEKIAYLFIAPTLILFICFTVIPIIMALYLSFTNYDVVSRMDWIGLSNYTRMLDDTLYWTTFKNIAFYVILYIPFNIVVSLSLGLLLNYKTVGVKVFRTVIYLPTLTSGIAAATVWLWLLNPEYGLVNQFLSYIGITGPAWLSDTNTAMVSIVLVTLWQSVGSNMIIYLAGIQGISEQLYEAAKLDGASKWQQIRYITWPQLRTTTFFISTMSIISAFQLFDQAFALTQGGPANATKTPVYLIYQEGFNQLNMGYASAQAFILALVIITFSTINIKLNQEK